MFRRVLVAVDVEGPAGHPLDDVAGILALARATLTLVTVVGPLPRFACLCGRDPDVLRAEAEQEGMHTLREAALRVAADIPVTMQLRRGDPGAEIIGAAREHAVDLVVLGGGGRAGFGRLGRRSVSRHVRLHSCVPVLRIPPQNRRRCPPYLGLPLRTQADVVAR